MKMRFSDLTSTNNHYYRLFRGIILVLVGVLLTVFTALGYAVLYFWTAYNASYRQTVPTLPEPPQIIAKWLNTVERV